LHILVSAPINYCCKILFFQIYKIIGNTKAKLQIF